MTKCMNWNMKWGGFDEDKYDIDNSIRVSVSLLWKESDMTRCLKCHMIKSLVAIERMWT